MRIDRVDPADSETLRSSYDLWLAACEVDDPEGRRAPFRVFRISMTTGWDGSPREMWTARADDGTLLGYYMIELPDKENLHRAYLGVTVDPAARRRGTGRALLAHATEQARGQGRTMLAGSAWQGTAGDAFCRVIGARPDLAEIRRVQVLSDIKPDTLARLRDEARHASAGYSLVSWREPIPEEYVEAVIPVLTGFEDAPRSESAEVPTWTAERIRAENELFKTFGQRGYTVAARHDATGGLAAMSAVFVDPEDLEWGYQGITAVVREHRGHRLGLLTKIAVLDWLAEAETRLTHIETSNAEVNSHMIAVNEALGYHILGPPMQDWELDIPVPPPPI